MARNDTAVAVCLFVLAVFGNASVAAAGEGTALQLAVSVNAISTNLITGFVLLEDGRIAAAPADLGDAGIAVPARLASADIVVLDDLPGVTYRYDEPSQSIDIRAAPDDLKSQYFELRGTEPAPSAQAGWGAVLNYDAFGTAGSAWTLPDVPATSLALSLEGRVFSPIGQLQNSAILRADAAGASEAIRLDTTYTFSDQPKLTTYRLGDVVTGGLAWTRPIRIGGAQARTDFALRPDLITAPMPALRGTASVPSTVDVYVDNAKAYSQQVGAGPFVLSNVPQMSGTGEARVVITDPSGHQTESTIPFYPTASLLAPGLTQWSVEAGFPRLSYGANDDRYGTSFVGSGSLRRGITDWMTAELHAEGGAGIAAGGIGTVVSAGPFGTVSGAMSSSMGPRGTGAETYLALQTSLYGLSLNARAQGTIGAYDDLASATARTRSGSTKMTGASAPPRQLFSLTLGAPLVFDPDSNLSANFVHLIDGSGTQSDIVSASYSRTLPFDGSLNASIYHDFAGTGRTGVFAGFALPLGPSATWATTASAGAGGASLRAELSDPLGPGVGESGWFLRDTEGQTSSRAAGAAYRSGFGVATATLGESRGNLAGTLELRGSVVTMDGNIFAADWIDDGFAVVHAGVPGVKVLSESRVVGVTDRRGLLLVPGLRAYEANHLRIDPVDLPVDAAVGSVEQVVAPAKGSGVAVAFDVKQATNAALVSFAGPDGVAIPAGAMGTTASGVSFAVGYDGQAFVEGLGPANEVTIDYLGQSCRAVFPFTEEPGQQVQLGPITCVPV